MLVRLINELVENCAHIVGVNREQLTVNRHIRCSLFTDSCLLFTGFDTETLATTAGSICIRIIKLESFSIQTVCKIKFCSA